MLNKKIYETSVVIEQQLSGLKAILEDNLFELSDSEKQSLESVINDLEHADEELGNLYR